AYSRTRGQKKSPVQFSCMQHTRTRMAPDDRACKTNIRKFSGTERSSCPPCGILETSREQAVDVFDQRLDGTPPITGPRESPSAGRTIAQDAHASPPVVNRIRRDGVIRMPFALGARRSRAP